MNLFNPEECVEFLSNSLGSKEDITALVSSCFYSHNLIDKLNFTGSKRTFLRNLVTSLLDYGELESGKQALSELLICVSKEIGIEKSSTINELIKKIELTQLKTNNVSYFKKASNYNDEFSIIEEIFRFVINKIELGEGANYSFKDKLDTQKKIRLNFTNEDERKEVENYYKFCLLKVELINKAMDTIDSYIQNDIHSHIFHKYKKYKRDNMKNIDILDKLFGDFVPAGKDDIPSYTSLSKALVLYFFDDCTIFESLMEA